jgi:transcription elongation factor Elf1
MMLGAVTLQEAESQAAKFFPWCPFCCSEKLEINVEPNRICDSLKCENCGAKWDIEIREKIRSVKLISTSVDWKGRELLGKSTKPQFWQKKAWLCILTRRNPP